MLSSSGLIPFWLNDIRLSKYRMVNQAFNIAPIFTTAARLLTAWMQKMERPDHQGPPAFLDNDSGTFFTQHGFLSFRIIIILNEFVQGGCSLPAGLNHADVEDKDLELMGGANEPRTNNTNPERGHLSQRERGSGYLKKLRSL